jgi:hypothetical protein
MTYCTSFISRKSASLFLHTPVGVSLPMNTKKGRALFPILKTALSREETRIAPLQVDGGRKATPTSVPSSAKLPLNSLTDLMASKKELSNPVGGISGANRPRTAIERILSGPPKDYDFRSWEALCLHAVPSFILSLDCTEPVF